MTKSNPKKLKILVVHGPNLNLLGAREANVYGTTTLKEIETQLISKGQELGVTVENFQSNSEGEIVTCLQNARSQYDGILINPAAYTHTSVAIRDALLGIGLPAVEVHLSNIYQREDFRHHSFVAPVVLGQISGFGILSYLLGLEGLVSKIRNKA